MLSLSSVAKQKTVSLRYKSKQLATRTFILIGSLTSFGFLEKNRSHDSQLVFWIDMWVLLLAVLCTGSANLVSTLEITPKNTVMLKGDFAFVFYSISGCKHVFHVLERF
jgi:hypothetical protein